ncbi:hypothetical protein [Wolbachia endosymbiont of Drosophila bicornuta]
MICSDYCKKSYSSLFADSLLLIFLVVHLYSTSRNSPNRIRYVLMAMLEQ